MSYWFFTSVLWKSLSVPLGTNEGIVGQHHTVTGQAVPWTLPNSFRMHPSGDRLCSFHFSPGWNPAVYPFLDCTSRLKPPFPNFNKTGPTAFGIWKGLSSGSLASAADSSDSKQFLQNKQTMCTVYLSKGIYQKHHNRRPIQTVDKI